MPPIGTQQIVQNSPEVSRIQEALQQQNDLQKRTAENKVKKNNERQRKTVEKSEQKDQVTINSDQEHRKFQQGQKEEDEEKKSEDTESIDGNEEKKGSHISVTI